MFMLKLNPKLLQEAFPINKVEVFFDAEDHSNFLGFTWEMISQGRVPVGLDTSDTDFNEIGKTGGSKYLQEHNHSIKTGFDFIANSGSKTSNYAKIEGEIGTFTTANAGTGNSGNLQPYIVMAFWRRIA